MDAAGEFVAQRVPGHSLNQFIVGGGSKVTEVISEEQFLRIRHHTDSVVMLKSRKNPSNRQLL